MKRVILGIYMIIALHHTTVAAAYAPRKETATTTAVSFAQSLIRRSGEQRFNAATQSKIFEDALTNGADPNAEVEPGRSLFSFFVDLGHAPLVSQALKNGASPNTRNPRGLTPLMQACLGGKVDIVKLLLEANVNVTITLCGQTAEELIADKTEDAFAQIRALYRAIP